MAGDWRKVLAFEDEDEDEDGMYDSYNKAGQVYQNLCDVGFGIIIKASIIYLYSNDIRILICWLSDILVAQIHLQDPLDVNMQPKSILVGVNGTQ